MGGVHHVSDWAGVPMSSDRPDEEVDLEREVARLAREFDPVPSSVVDDARAAFFARTRPGRGAPEPAAPSDD